MENFPSNWKLDLSMNHQLWNKDILTSGDDIYLMFRCNLKHLFSTSYLRSSKWFNYYSIIFASIPSSINPKEKWKISILRLSFRFYNLFNSLEATQIISIFLKGLLKKQMLYKLFETPHNKKKMLKLEEKFNRLEVEIVLHCSKIKSNTHQKDTFVTETIITMTHYSNC